MYASISNAATVFNNIVTFSSTIPVASDITGARVVLYPGTGRDWYGFGMSASTLNYNVPATATHKSYCGTSVYASISNTATAFNSIVNFPSTMPVASDITGA